MVISRVKRGRDSLLTCFGVGGVGKEGTLVLEILIPDLRAEVQFTAFQPNNRRLAWKEYLKGTNYWNVSLGCSQHQYVRSYYKGREVNS